MKVITISREYGAGGGEVARKLAERLGWEILDRELLHQAAAIEHVPDAELARLDEKAISMADRLSLHPPHQKYLHGLTEAVRRAAERGNVILVGRGVRHLLGGMPGVFHLRLVAPLEWRAKRMARLEGKSVDEAHDRCLEVDHVRELFTRYFFGQDDQRRSFYESSFGVDWSSPLQYHVTINNDRLAHRAVDLISLAAERHWSRME